MKLKFEYLVSGILLTLLAIFFSKTYSNIFSYNLDIAGHEQILVNYILVFYETGNIYFNSYVFPYFQNLYTPIYFIINDLVLQTKSIVHEINIREIYLVGRYISWIACILNVIIIFLISKQLKITTAISLIASVLFIFNISNHSFAVRPDSIKDLFFSINVLLLILYIQKNKNIYFIGSLIFSVLSIYTKQDSLLYILGFSISLIFLRKYKTFIYYNLSIGLISISLLLILNIYYKGEFLDNLLNTNIEFSSVFWDRWIDQIKLFVNVSWISIFIILLAYPYRNKTYKALVITNLIFFVTVLLTTIKFGAANNYYTPLYFILFITSAYSLQQILYQSNTNLLKVFCIFLVIYNLYTLQIPQTYNKIEEEEFKEEYLEIQNVSNYLKSKYIGSTFIILDQSFSPFIPHNMMLKNFSMIYFDFLYSKYGFETEEKLTISDSYEIDSIQTSIKDIDYLMLKLNERNTILYNKKYNKNYQFSEEYNGYYIYINKRLIQ